MGNQNRDVEEKMKLWLCVRMQEAEGEAVRTRKPVRHARARAEKLRWVFAVTMQLLKRF